MGIYEFLWKVIQCPGFPTANFTIDLPDHCRGLVHFIGPLRPRIPTYGFQRAELDEWVRHIVQRSPVLTKGGCHASTSSSAEAVLQVGQRVVVQTPSTHAEIDGKVGQLL